MDDNILRIGEREIKAFSERNPADIPWGDLGVDIVVESSGVFTDRDSAAGHLEGGAKKVVISAPAKGADATFVYKVNHESYDPENHHVVSNSSCTTNCIIPMEGVAGQLRDRVGLHDDLPRLHQRPEPHRLGAQRPQAPGPPPRTSSRPPRGPLVRPV